MKISGFESIVSIDKFEYLNRMDRHAFCSFSACIKADVVDNALGMIDSDIDFDDDNFRFTGHVIDVSVSKDISGTYIDVKTIGKTYLYDQDKYSRIFQQGDKSVSDILSHMKSMSDTEIQEGEDSVVENIIFQNNETEWNFIKRLINRYGLHIFPREKVYIGKHGSDQAEVTEETLIDYKINANSKGAHIVFIRKREILF